MDSGAPVNLKNSVCRRITAATTRRAQVKMVLILELVAIRNLLPTFVAGVTESLQRNVVAREMIQAAAFLRFTRGRASGRIRDLARYARNLFSQHVPQQSRPCGHRRCDAGHRENPRPGQPRGYERPGLRSPSAACGRTCSLAQHQPRNW